VEVRVHAVFDSQRKDHLEKMIVKNGDPWLRGRRMSLFDVPKKNGTGGLFDTVKMAHPQFK
jgi:hypothetical protein